MGQAVTPEQMHLPPINVLLVEDNELNADIAMVQLNEYGINVTRACDGMEAVEIFEGSVDSGFDLILMDIMMPRMNGYDAARAIRSMKNRADSGTIPIIAMSANDLDEDVKASLDAGMDAHIAKPLIIEDVIRLLAGTMVSKKMYHCTRIYKEGSVQ